MTQIIDRRFLVLCVLSIVILGSIVYANSLSGPFFWDDIVSIKNNIYIQDWSKLWNVFTEYKGSESSIVFPGYRPLQLFSYWIDFSIWKLNAFGFHLTNIALHLLASLALFGFTYLLFRNKILSLLSGLFFVCYPVHVEAVSYISSRANSLVMLFTLLSFIFYIKYLRSQRSYAYILMLLSFCAALLSKESAIIMPFLILLYHYAFSERIKLKAFASVAVVGMAYCILRISMLGSMYQGSDDLFRRIPGFFVAVSAYLRILFLPLDLHCDYGNKIFSFADPRAILGLIASVVLIWYAFRLKRKRPVISFSILWFFIALLPTTGIYPRTAFFMADHWLYFPSIGFFMILAFWFSGLYQDSKKRFFAVGATVFIILFYSYLTVRENSYWKNPISLFERSIQLTPDSASVHNNLGYEYLNSGKFDKALVEFRRAIAIDPRSPAPYCNLGIVHVALGEYDKAWASFRKAVELKPDYALAYNELCLGYGRMGKCEEAVPACKRLTEISPRQPSAYYNLGNSYDKCSKKKEAIDAYQKAIALKPDYSEALNNLAAVYVDAKQIDEAIAVWNKLVKVSPGFSIAHFNLAVFYFQQKKYDLAIRHCDKVIELGDQVDPAFLKLLKPYRK